MPGVMSAIAGAPIRIRHPRVRAEDAIQTSIVAFLRLVLPADRYCVFSVPNGAGKLSKVMAKRLKDMGLLAGVADLLILARGGRAYAMEVKSEDGVPSQAQKTFRKWCQVNGIPHAYARSVDDARRAVADWNLKTREAA